MTKEEVLVLEERNLAEYRGDDEVLPFADILQKEKERGRANINYSLGSSFTYLNSLIGGCRPGELVVISGPPKSGKTLFLQTLTWDFIFNGVMTLWLSYEMPIVQFIERFPGYPIPPQSFSPGRITENTMVWLENRIREAKIKHNIKAVAIDHLHYLVSMANMRNPSLEIGSVLRSLVLLSQKHNVMIFLIAHIGKIERGKIPRGDSIRDSSFILQEPATVLMVYRVKDEPENHITNQAWISVIVNRQLGTMGKRVRIMKGEGGLLAELDFLTLEQKKAEEVEPEDNDG